MSLSNHSQPEFKAGKRKHARIEFPAKIRFSKEVIEVSEWSLGGFSLADGCIHETEIDCQNASLSFYIPQGKFELTVKFKVSRASADGFAVGFQFIDLPEYVLESMQTIINGYLSGEQINLDQALEKGVKASVFELEQSRLIANWGKFALVVSGIAFVLGFTLFLLYHKFYVVTSEHAAVAQRVVKVETSTAGVLADMQVKPGKVFASGSPLFSVTPEDQRELLRQKQSSSAALALEITHIQNRYHDAKNLLSSFSTRLYIEAEGLKQRLKALKTETMIQSEQSTLFYKHYKEGVVDEVTKNNNLLQLYEKQRKLLTLKQQLDITKNQLAMTKKGLLVRDDVSSLPTVNELEDLLAYKVRYQNLLVEEIKQLDLSRFYTSPCDCEVVEISATNGQMLGANTPVIKLSPVSENQRWILALVSLEQGKRLYKGAKAKFRLASESVIRTGKVENINYYSASQPILYSNMGETISGLPDSLPRMQQYTLVKVLPDEPLTKAKFSEPAVVTINLGFLNWFRGGVLL